MYNVEKLEQQWIRYRRKKILLPVASAAAVLLVAAGVIYYVGSQNSVADRNDTVMAGSTAETPQKKPPEVKKSTVATLNSLSTAVPSLGETAQNDRPKVGQIIFQDETKATTHQAKKRKNLLIQVTERGSKDIAIDIENRFEFAKDKSDSLFLAKYYYDKMDYAKAEKWALETNKLDNTIEESWLIFAKAQAKQGKRIEALKVLKAFLDQRSSTKAKILMDRIRRGKNF